MEVVAKCLHFVISYMRQNIKHKQTLESAQYELEMSIKYMPVKEDIEIKLY